jgi:hypothetical protein
MRLELLELLYAYADARPRLTGRTGGMFDAPRDLYENIADYVGASRAKSHDAVRRLAWPRVYEMVTAFYTELWRRRDFKQFSHDVNRILSAHRVAWEFCELGVFRRLLLDGTLPQVDHALVERICGERSHPSGVLGAAQRAFDARPRGDLVACAFVFEALESFAQRVLKTQSPFAEVLDELERGQRLPAAEIARLRDVLGLRRKYFSQTSKTHDALSRRATPLSPGQVDTVYVTCLDGIRSLGALTRPA